MMETRIVEGRQQYLGKFRGKVLDNVDPLFQGRIMADVPAIQGSTVNWAMPCVPYAGPEVGFYAIPPIGANVWIEFEGGDPNYPIWAGCFWGPTDILMVPEPPPPEVKVFKTEFITMILNDLPEVGGFTLKCLSPAVNVPLTMLFNAEGIQILCPESSITMTPGSINLAIPEADVTMVPESVTITVPEAVIEMTAELISIAVPASSIELTAGAIEVEAPEVSVTGETNVEPVFTVEGESNLLGAVTIEGETNIAGALTVEGAVDIAGGIAIEGGGVIDGAPII
ncbi:phage baseplate assembly protein V [Phenylobacterium sp.]|uniref:phage baseplate assembly protein V n=1 Tax=Phenylobacterium sp. TaxID=1871053 RepID=UPI003BA9C0A8